MPEDSSNQAQTPNVVRKLGPIVVVQCGRCSHHYRVSRDELEAGDWRRLCPRCLDPQPAPRSWTIDELPEHREPTATGEPPGDGSGSPTATRARGDRKGTD